MDVDGVLTDGTVHISSDGTETKSFSILDGMGLVRLNKAGVIVAWISGRASGATTARATELKVPHLIQGRIDKLSALQELATALGLILLWGAVGDFRIHWSFLIIGHVLLTLPFMLRAELSAVLQVLEHAPLLLGRPNRFSALVPPLRMELMADILDHGPDLAVDAVVTCTRMVHLIAYGNPELWLFIGYDGPKLDLSKPDPGEAAYKALRKEAKR
jgi:YrbI family 3-deoxy-D-manno-octulosonate 8-phosphate phosphatase